MFGAIVGLLTALPKILELGQNVWAWLQKVSGNDAAGFIDKVNSAFILLNKAQTEQEYVDAAKAIRDAIHSTR